MVEGRVSQFFSKYGIYGKYVDVFDGCVLRYSL